MKKALLLFLGMMSFVAVSANDKNVSTEKTITINGYDEAVSFIERGVQFHVFLNGDFEFDSPNRNYYKYNNRRYRQNNIRIDRDYQGRIKRVGSNYIRYDYKGNVTRIGNIKIYYRRGFVRKVGALKVSYNNWGDPYFYGNVHRDYYDSGIQLSLNFGSVFNYNDRYFYDYSFKNNYRKYREDKHYYYYKVKPNGKVGKRGKLIKRRKAGVTTRRNNNNSYIKRKIAPNRKTIIKRNTTPKRVKVIKKKVKRRTHKINVKKELNKKKVAKKQERRRRN